MNETWTKVLLVLTMAAVTYELGWWVGGIAIRISQAYF